MLRTKLPIRESYLRENAEMDLATALYYIAKYSGSGEETTIADLFAYTEDKNKYKNNYKVEDILDDFEYEYNYAGKDNPQSKGYNTAKEYANQYYSGMSAWEDASVEEKTEALNAALSRGLVKFETYGYTKEEPHLVIAK